jgi:hypothetical protein
MVRNQTGKGGEREAAYLWIAGLDPFLFSSVQAGRRSEVAEEIDLAPNPFGGTLGHRRSPCLPKSLWFCINGCIPGPHGGPYDICAKPRRKLLQVGFPGPSKEGG